MKISIASQFEDERGKIADLLVNESIDAITQITFAESAVRANHYHKHTTQWTYVVSGKLTYASGPLDGPIVEETIEAGDFVVAEPNELHAFKALVKSEIFVFTKGPRAGFDYEKDTFRLEEPLLK